jgi:hemoglobin-like flavoprotein
LKSDHAYPGAMTAPAPTPQQIELARASYERCLRQEEFFRSFYARFLASDPAIAPQFADTRFDRQHKLLQHGLGLLLSYAGRPNPHLLERIAERHGPTDLNVPEYQYPLFLESLLFAVRTHDPECTPAVEEAWTAALLPGVEYLEHFGR